MLSPLNRIDRLIAESEARIEEQYALIAIYEQAGMSTVESKKRLRDFEDSLKAYRDTRASIVEVRKLLDEGGSLGL